MHKRLLLSLVNTLCVINNEHMESNSYNNTIFESKYSFIVDN